MREPIIRIFRGGEVVDTYNDVEELPVLVYSELIKVHSPEDIIKLSYWVETGEIALTTFDGKDVINWCCVHSATDFSAIGRYSSWDVLSIY